MADKKELPISGGLFYPYGQANANGSQASSSNFNPSVAAAGFNRMAAGYPGAAAAAFYSSPFSTLPFATAASVNAPNSMPFLNHGPANMFATGFPTLTSPVWPGLLPPDYLLNIAALQSLQHPASTVIDGGGETFNDVLKKMPKASTTAAVNGENRQRISSANTSSHLHGSIPSTAASSTSSPLSKPASSTAIKPANIDTSASIPRASSSTASSFSATSLAISDQKLASPSSSISSGDLSSGRQHQHHHSSSLATLAEIAASLQSNDRYQSKAVKNAAEKQKTVVKEPRTLALDATATPARSSDHLKRPKTEGDTNHVSSDQRRSSKISTNASGSSTLDFSRKRPSGKISGENGEVVKRKEPKLERVESPSNSKTCQQAEAGSKRDQNEHRQSGHRHDQSAGNDNTAAAAATLFGNSLSSDLKMDPNLLNASAMAWAALSNQWLFANVQNEILNRVAAAALQQQPQSSSTTARSGNSHSSAKASPAVPMQSEKPRTHPHPSSGRRRSRGRPATISASAQSSHRKDAVDITIDAVIKRQQQEMATTSDSSSHSPKGTSVGRTKRGRGSRGGITVREQLAAKRGFHSADDVSSPILNGCSTGQAMTIRRPSTGDSEKSSVTSEATAPPQMAALDLSVKHQATLSSAKDSNSSANGVVSATGVDHEHDSDDSDDSTTSSGSLAKKRRVAEADAVRLPLNKGWRRQTYVRGISSNCIRGDVIYYAPCGKRLGSYAEVLRYLNKHNIMDIDRENFSFSCKVLVGEFMHVKSDGGKNGIVKLSEKDLRELLSKTHSNACSQMKDGNGFGGFSDRARRQGLSSLTRRNASRRAAALQTRFGQASVSDGRQKGNGGIQQSLTDHGKPVWETKRLEREREYQMSEHERKRKLDFMRNQKVMEAMQRAKAKEIRQHMESMNKQEDQYAQQMAMLEREKVRQQMLFSRALEARRRQEEKERLYAEKLIRREERLAARTASLMKLRQMRQPCEDMEIENCKELPALNRMENMDLDGQAFADLLMVMEFINNFGHVLKLDKTEIPDIGEVHAGLLNDRRGVQSLRNLVKTLLLLVLEYPGLPAGNGGKTLLGQPAKDVGVTDMNMSELLKMFLLSRDEQGKELGNDLENKPYEVLSPSRKAAILAYMCNELLYCRNVVREIEGNIDVIAKFKSDRWALEGKIRHMKVVQASKRKNDKNVGNTKEVSADDPGTSASTPAPDKSPMASKLPEDDDDDDAGDSSDSDAKMDSSNQEAGSSGKRTPKTLFGITAGEIESISKEEKQMPAEEVDRELERLRKEMHELRSRVSEVSVRVRASPFGQDRYSRYYWILPHHSGVFVEGVESGGAHNPAVKYVSPPNGPTSSNAVARSISPSKHADEVRHCVQDLVETIVRSDGAASLESAYAEVKVERSTASAEASAEASKAAASTKASATKVPGSKKMKPVPFDLQQGWWLIDNSEQLEAIPPHLHHRGIRERQLNRMLTKHVEHVKRAAFQSEKIAVNFGPVAAPSDSEPKDLILRSARRLLNMTRQLEEKVFHANVHVKGWKPTEDTPDATPPHPSAVDGTSSDSSCDSILDSGDRFASHSTDDLLTVVKDRLLRLELSIERRYFMPAFNRETSKLYATANTPPTVFSAESEADDALATPDEPMIEDEDDIPLALERWRSGVGKASNIAQLSMCLEELDAQVAWEKSVMKASCQICRGGDNESQLLLCDGCDLGYHTYCFKPKLDTVPEGDWFCPECVAKATRRPCCLLCCRQASRPMIACTECSKNFHLDCLPGPVKKTRSGAWTCGGCCNSKGQGKFMKTACVDIQCSASISSTPASEPTKPRKRPPKKSLPLVKNGAKSSPSASESVAGPLKFHELCSIMLAELDAHKDAGPFRLPVDIKGCPLYKKVIKQPMDLSTIQLKLTNKKYDNEQQFVGDLKLIFDNCRTFNEDDSPVGKSGHALRRFFNKRWKDLKESNGKKSS